MITIIDYKTGNLGSIANMIKRVGGKSIVTSDLDIIRQSKKIILPGVGSFDNGVLNLKNFGIWDVLKFKVEVEKTPILGICLGAQLMTKGSEEGEEKGFGWVMADTVKFSIDRNPKFKVPNMGWRSIYQVKESKLMSDMFETPRFYFVHSYHFKFENQDEILTNSYYSYEFVSAFETNNVLGVQFHPEKSHKYGTRLIRNFNDKY